MILTYVCFLPGSIGPSQLAGILEFGGFGFTAQSVKTDRFGGSKGVPLSEKSVDQVRSLDAVSSATVAGLDGSLRLTGMGGWPTQLLVVETKESVPSVLIEQAARLDGFVAAMVGDGDDVFWQSADQINTYQVHGRPWEHLPKVRDEIFGGEKLDVSGNHGRQVPFPGMWLWAAAKTWFGPLALDLVDRSQVLSLPVGNVIERPDQLVVVELFDMHAGLEEVRARQEVFREWLDFDTLERRSVEYAERLSDPRLEVETGEFSNGAVRRITEWLLNGDASPRSRANERRTTELGPHGETVRQEIVAKD